METTNSNNKYNYNSSLDVLLKNTFDMRNFSDFIQQSVLKLVKVLVK